MKKNIYVRVVFLALLLMLAGCGKASADANGNAESTVEMTTDEKADEVIATEATSSNEDATEVAGIEILGSLELEDGKYLVKFDTDSTMFHVNDTMDGKAILTVENKAGMLHLVMPSKNVLNLYIGMANDAENNEADWIVPSTEEVTYEDGMTEEVFAFDVPVNVIGEEFDLALIGKKGVWYDHKVSISEPQEITDGDETADISEAGDDETEGKTIEVTLEGGTGKVSLVSPTEIRETQDGFLLTVKWTSKNYDYMIVDGVKYLPVEVNECSVFEIPVKGIDNPLEVIADTVAMSEPHEIEYKIIFDTTSLK